MADRGYERRSVSAIQQTSRNERGHVAVAYALLAVARQIEAVARVLRARGQKGDADG